MLGFPGVVDRSALAESGRIPECGETFSHDEVSTGDEVPRGEQSRETLIPRSSAPGTTPRWWNFMIALQVVGLLGIAVWFRLWRLGDLPGINGDEAFSGVRAIQLLRGESIPWRTPTGNPLNLFFLLPSMALHWVFSPSLVLLRVPAVVSGLLLLVVNYWLCRPVFGRRVAVVSTVVLAVLPINIVYSRIGWDTSQTVLATTVMLYLALRSVTDRAHWWRWSILATLALGASLLVHPTNVFLAPLWLVAVGDPWRDRVCAWFRPGPNSRRWMIPWGVVLLAVLLVTWFARHVLGTGSGRMPNGAEWGLFVRHYLRLFSGVTVYDYVAGSWASGAGDDAPRWLGFGVLDWASVVVALGVLAGVVGMVWRGLLPAQRALLWGALFSGGAFFLVAGAAGIEPHWERYGLCLIAPACAVASLAAMWLWERMGRWQVAGTLAGLMGCWLMLLSVQTWYLGYVAQTGGNSHLTWRTGTVEPKAAALDYVLEHRGSDDETWIVCAQWWNYWPLRYLAMNDPTVRVERWEQARHAAELQRAMDEDRLWFVEFWGSPATGHVQSEIFRRKFVSRGIVMTDAGGRPLIEVFRPVYAARWMGADPVVLPEPRHPQKK